MQFSAIFNNTGASNARAQPTLERVEALA